MGKMNAGFAAFLASKKAGKGKKVTKKVAVKPFAKKAGRGR
jgi:hypothetical protein